MNNNFIWDGDINIKNALWHDTEFVLILRRKTLILGLLELLIWNILLSFIWSWILLIINELIFQVKDYASKYSHALSYRFLYLTGHQEKKLTSSKIGKRKMINFYKYHWINFSIVDYFNIPEDKHHLFQAIVKHFMRNKN